MLSKKQLFTRGMLDISPHMLSVIPFGIICGAIGVELGFDPYLVYAMSFIIFGVLHKLYFYKYFQVGHQV
jgi:predicted branched-subunit amino acid permease